MLDLIALQARHISAFHVSLYEQEGGSFRFKAELTLINGSRLHIKEYVFENKERKYAYHWIDASGRLICRWDNANHYPDVSTFPHHKHENDKVLESTQTSFEDVLNVICGGLEKEIR